jgi:hypothetical protein
MLLSASGETSQPYPIEDDPEPPDLNVLIGLVESAGAS